MADLADIASTLPVKIAGADNGGNETSFVDATNGQLQTRDVLGTAGQNRAQSVTTSAAEALGGIVILPGRKCITLTPTNGTIYWGYSSGVTTASGSPIFKNQTVTIAATDSLHIYVIAATTVDCRISEAS